MSNDQHNREAAIRSLEKHLESARSLKPYMGGDDDWFDEYIRQLEYELLEIGLFCGDDDEQ